MVGDSSADTQSGLAPGEGVMTLPRGSDGCWVVYERVNGMKDLNATSTSLFVLPEQLLCAVNLIRLGAGDIPLSHDLILRPDGLGVGGPDVIEVLHKADLQTTSELIRKAGVIDDSEAVGQVLPEERFKGTSLVGGRLAQRAVGDRPGVWNDEGRRSIQLEAFGDSGRLLGGRS
jgi:hypothetical protein